MSAIEDTYTPALAVVLSALAQLPTSASVVDGFDDDKILVTISCLADARRLLDASAALLAGVVDHRSRPELGYSGLAQREGFRTPEKLIQHTTGSTAREASTLVAVGALVLSASPPASLSTDPLFVSAAPWLRLVGAAVSSGSLSVAAAEAIRNGLGQRSDHVTALQLAQAVDTLLLEALLLDADKLFRHARDLRDALDAEGIADRERRIHEQRGVRQVARPDGSTRIIIDTDLESGAYLCDLFGRMTSPRRGGPRFVAEDEKVWADAVSNDPRTTAQLLHDGLMQLVRIGVTSDSTSSRAVVGSRQPSVRVLVSADALTAGVGFGRIESTGTPGSGETASVTAVSIETVERLACTDGTIAISFDSTGQVLNLGREQRLFTAGQRIALAARDGGCRWVDCDRPPSWTEAHHTQHWKAGSGRTDVADGILLCRHHHMLLHNNHWDITRNGAEYWLTPPAGIDAVGVDVTGVDAARVDAAGVDAARVRRLLPSHSAALRDLLGAALVPAG